MSPKVLCVLISSLKKDSIDKKCLNSILSQDYENFSILVHYSKTKNYSEDKIKNLYLNCSENREAARKIALESDAEYFLFLDSDIELKKDAITKFMLQAGEKKTTCNFPDGKGNIIPKGTPVPEKHVQGGWYAVYNMLTGKEAFYVAGKFVADYTFLNFVATEKSLVSTDLVGMGCVFITKKALLELYFEAGLDLNLKNSYGHYIIAGECLAFSNLAFEKGYALYMNGDVICKHHKKGRYRAMFKHKLRSILNLKSIFKIKILWPILQQYQ